MRDGEHRVVVDGVELWYRVAGRATDGVPPVVFLHGGPGQGSAHFDALAGPRLEPTLRMVYFDQRGSGHSERPASNEYTIERLVDDIEGLRKHLGATRIALVAHSFGGVLALEYAAKHPERTAAVVFASGLWDAPGQCALRLQRVARYRPALYARVQGDTLNADGSRRSDCAVELAAFPTREERAAWDTEAMYPDPAVEARIDSVNAAHGIRNTGEIGRALFSSGLLRYRFAAFDRLTMPVLVIAGGRDRAVAAEGLRALAERLPDGRFVEYERSGHFVYLDEPERFARDVTALVTAAARR
ncbi:MAG TPA: alpha/beta hydrolase [Longimicrobium sp.]|nr:alpha/beta hydrolase [Longimicrobium sp.]